VDGSTDETLSYLNSGQLLDVPIVVLVHPGNTHRGRAATRNLPLGRLEDEFVWLADSDMELAPDALASHLALSTTRACTSVGAVDYLNAAENPWACYLDTRGRHRYPDGAVLPFTQFTTANSLVRSAYMEELGGFDERFVTYGGEDIDFAYRLQQLSGEPFINNRGAIARTVEDKTIDQALVQFECYGAGNLRLLEDLHPEMPRTFELQRLTSRRLADRVFAASINHVVERIIDALVTVGHSWLRNRLLNYKVIAAVWRGYRSASSSS
jgi:hypothetical protein